MGNGWAGGIALLVLAATLFAMSRADLAFYFAWVSLVGAALCFGLGPFRLLWLRKNITFRLRYAHGHFETFEHLKLPADACVRIPDHWVLHPMQRYAAGEQIPLVPCIGNENGGWPLREARLYVQFVTPGVEVFIEPDGRWREGVNRGGVWQVEVENEVYCYKFPGSIIMENGSVQHALNVRFHPDVLYTINWTLIAETIGQMRSTFFIHLRPPS